MMVERHYDDEALIALIEADRVKADGHVPSCPACSGKLQSFETIAAALHEHDVWDTREVRTQPVPSTIANLRAFADRMASEDAQAEAIVAELLAGPREEWMPRLMANPAWRTAGVVRKLVAGMPATVMSMPPDALEMTLLSTEIADHLVADEVRPDEVAKLRGSAWRDRAYAFYYVGRFSESLAAADRADGCFSACRVADYDHARVAVVRVLSLQAREEDAAAILAAESSAATFAAFGDETRFAAARIAETHALFSLREYEKARKVLEALEARLRSTDDVSTHARVLANLGYCYRLLGRIDEALAHNEAAATLFDDTGVQTEAVRQRWIVADILVSAGRFDEARPRLEKVWKEFEDLGMTSEAALASLQIAELLLARGEFHAVESIAQDAIRSFEKAGVSYTARALTALAYIREAARLRTATPTLARRVREYLGRLPLEGELLVARPFPERDLPRHG